MKQLPSVRSVRVAVGVFVGPTSLLCRLGLTSGSIYFPLASLSGILLP